MRPPNLNLCRGDFCETDVVSLTPGARDRGRDACRIYCYRSGAGRERNTECILRIILLAARAASFNRKSVSGGFWIVGKRAPFRVSQMFLRDLWRYLQRWRKNDRIVRASIDTGWILQGSRTMAFRNLARNPWKQ